MHGKTLINLGKKTKSINFKPNTAASILKSPEQHSMLNDKTLTQQIWAAMPSFQWSSLTTCGRHAPQITPHSMPHAA